MFYLHCNMNLLIYGVGSKQNLIDTFVRDFIRKEWEVVRVLAYHAELLPKKILYNIHDFFEEQFSGKKKKKCRG